MNKFFKISKKEITPIIGIILFLSIFRLIPHPYNFTPILAAGVFSGFYFKNFFLSSFIVVLSMFIGDVFLGFHGTMIFTYTSLLIAVVIGLMVKNFKFKEIFITGLASSISFFLITNFGAWMMHEMYEKNLAGLIQSYVLAIPFFHNTLISTFVYLLLIKIIFDFCINRKIIKI